MFASRNSVLTKRTTSTPSSFVTRDPVTGNLMLNGSRFRFGGANCANDIGSVGPANGNPYGATVDATGDYYITPHAQVDALLTSASAMKLGVLKATWSVHTVSSGNAVEPSLGSYNTAALDPICYAISQAKPLGIRFVLPFCEEYFAKGWYVSQTGGGSTDNFYTRTATINAYKNHISFVLDHVNPYTGVALKNEPQIVCWQIGNEFTAPSLTWQQYADWGDDIGHHIKVVKGAQQLVQDGHYGPGGSTELMAQTWIDGYDQHAYDQYRTPSFLENEAAFCHANGKFYFVGEFDWTDAPTNPSLAHTNWYVDEQLDAWERSSNIDGATFWDLLGPNTAWNDGYTLHYPGTSNDMSQRAGMLSDHAQRMTGITPKTFVSDDFTGTNGTTQTAHTGATGAVWAYVNGWTGPSAIQNNRLYAGASDAVLYASGIPASADYTVTADIYTASLVSTGYAGVTGRSYTTGDYYYDAYIWWSSGTATIYLEYGHPGTDTTLGAHVVTTPTVGSTHTLRLKLQGTSLSVYWDNMTTPVIGPITHTSLTAAGRAGTVQGHGSATTGFHIDSFTATDL